MDEKKSEKNIIEKLKSKDIKPKPKYKFLLKKYLLWASAILTVILGSLSLAIIYYFIRNQDIKLILQEASNIQMMLIYVPYLWIIILIIFLILAAYNLKHFEFGYRLKFSQIIISYFIASIILSLFVYNFGLADNLQKIFTNTIPAYQNYTHHRFLMWQQPEKGRILGKIMFDQKQQKYTLKDPQDKTWLLNLNHLQHQPRFPIKEGETVRIIGQIENSTSFKVYEILPLFKQPGSHCSTCPHHYKPYSR